ncbi:uncharacterized protein LOC115210757 isoform X1 [Octopus sinensis]|nr:uncharacterized protein LOC115210757 isoform X1 [Octopus sinensis]
MDSFQDTYLDSSFGSYQPKIMAEDPGHKAMLYFLEVLMNHSPSPLSISQLAGRFGSRNFTSEMRHAAGGNEAGLKKFLLKYPSLFTVNGNLVCLTDGTCWSSSVNNNVRDSSPASSSSSFSLPEVSIETEAVQYFRSKFLKKGEKWMATKSLAGHLSQASAEIRECVGPQNEFEDWLHKHPLIFEVKGDIVCLKDNMACSPLKSESDQTDDDGRQFAGDPGMLSMPLTPKLKNRPRSLNIMDAKPLKSPGILSSKSGPMTMTANEYKAVMFLKNIIEKKGDIKLNSLSGHFSQAPESLRNTIGWSKTELEKFLRQHSNIFAISEDETVSVIKNTRLNVVITGSKPTCPNKPTITNRKGKIYHVAKLWGIIDLGRHEHVFIDRCIFGRHIDDLNRLLSVGETVCFDAIPAPKGSRARWRATRVWKENESIEDMIDRLAERLHLPLDGRSRDPGTPLGNIDDELKKVIPDLNDNNILNSPVTVGGLRYAFFDAAPSGAGVVPVWNFKSVELEGMKDIDDLDLSDEAGGDAQNPSMVAERYYMNQSVLGDSPRDSRCHNGEKEPFMNGLSSNTNTILENGDMLNGQSADKYGADVDLSNEQTNGNNNNCCTKQIDASCQTIVTGDILATQFFHEGI